MEEDVEKAMDIEEEYEYKDDVTKPLKLKKSLIRRVLMMKSKQMMTVIMIMSIRRQYH